VGTRAGPGARHSGALGRLPRLEQVLGDLATGRVPGGEVDVVSEGTLTKTSCRELTRRGMKWNGVTSLSRGVVIQRRAS
jgi:hypothetical protein